MILILLYVIVAIALGFIIFVAGPLDAKSVAISIACAAVWPLTLVAWLIWMVYETYKNSMNGKK